METSEYIFGLHSVIEAIEAGRDIDKILVKKDLHSEMAVRLHDLARRYQIPMQRVPVERLNRITRKNHQGAIAMLSPVAYYDLDEVVTSCYEDGHTPLLVLLDGITDTRNFGAIARTASCADVDAIVIPEKNSVSVTPDAVKTSAGALMTLPVCRVRSILDAVKRLKSAGVKVVGASEKANTDYTDASLTEPTAIVMGAEDTGISDDVLRLCDEIVAIPMYGPIASLNVSVAAALMIYESVRQRRMDLE